MQQEKQPGPPSFGYDMRLEQEAWVCWFLLWLLGLSRRVEIPGSREGVGALLCQA